MYFPIDDSVLPILPARVLTPELWEPGKKPTGPMEIDWDNDLTRELMRYWLLDDQGSLKDLVVGEKINLTGAFNTVAGDLKFTGNQTTNYLRTETALDAGEDIYGWPSSLAPFDFTLSFKVKFVAQAADRALFQWSYTIGAGNPNVYIKVDSSGNVDFYSDAAYDLGAVDHENEWINIAVTGNGSTETLTHYINGVAVSSRTSAAWSGSANNQSSLWINNGFADSSTMPTSWQYFLWTRSRCFSDAEIAELHRDPYQILKPLGAML